ncbi:hypothetical protein TUMEXPCC7403_25205 [Tumidithrix helvetica PCC 7403]
MTRFVALLDACVLYPNYLRDILIQLALTDLFRAKWTDLIHEEWMRNVRSPVHKPARHNEMQKFRFAALLLSSWHRFGFIGS